MILWFGTGKFVGKNVLEATVQTANLWSWCLAGIGFAATHLNKKTKKLNYANQAVYPFYILHQTVLIIIGFYLKNQQWGDGTKFVLMVVGTFTISWVIYEFGIRRIPFIKTLFGLKK
jgi:peptidoglycan/LPS O-acetylase OafA/YrhL